MNHRPEHRHDLVEALALIHDIALCVPSLMFNGTLAIARRICRQRSESTRSTFRAITLTPRTITIAIE
jgi:hypothetical protein